MRPATRLGRSSEARGGHRGGSDARRLRVPLLGQLRGGWIQAAGERRYFLPERALPLRAHGHRSGPCLALHRDHALAPWHRGQRLLRAFARTHRVLRRGHRCAHRGRGLRRHRPFTRATAGHHPGRRAGTRYAGPVPDHRYLAEGPRGHPADRPHRGCRLLVPDRRRRPLREQHVVHERTSLLGEGLQRQASCKGPAGGALGVAASFRTLPQPAAGRQPVRVPAARRHHGDASRRPARPVRRHREHRAALEWSRRQHRAHRPRARCVGGRGPGR